jgi:hypothetical protein
MDDGDFSGKQHLPPTTSNQSCEGVAEQRHVSFADEVAQNNSDTIHLQPIADDTPNSWQMQTPINLDSSGLFRSFRTAVLNRRDKVYSNATQMIQDTLLPAGLGLHSANSSLPAGLGLCSANSLPAGLGLHSANSSLPAGLGLRSAKSPNLSVGLGVRSASCKHVVAALALFSSICSHGHGFSSSFQEKLSDATHLTFFECC